MDQGWELTERVDKGLHKNDLLGNVIPFTVWGWRWGRGAVEVL